MMSVQKQYDDIAELYDYLSEGDDGLIYTRIHIEKILHTLAKDARLLDCSCGTGKHAIWLARQGYSVYASDISEGMLRVAREKATNEHLTIKFFQSSWEQLPDKTDHIFDLIICPGNSLSHIEDFRSLELSFSSFRKVLKAGGSFSFDIRNWEKSFEEASLETQEFQVKTKNGKLDVRYSYQINGWNTRCYMYVDIRQQGKEEYARYTFDFFPASYQQYRDALLNAGFDAVERKFFPGDNYYLVIAQ
ncbi:MAG: class I SAM-dependent methyltransferase [Bacteroidota bacterium]